MRRIASLGILFAIASPALSATPLASFAALHRTLLRLPVDGPDASAAIDLPVGSGRVSRFAVRDSRTLPAGLTKRFPGLRSFRGTDGDGRTARLDLAGGRLLLAIRDDLSEWEASVRTQTQWDELGGPAAAPARAISEPAAYLPAHPGPDVRTDPRPSSSMARSGGAVRYDFRLAVAVGSRVAATWGSTVEAALGEVAHRVNRANEVFETDAGVHFTLVEASDRLVMTRPKHDPFLSADPAPANVDLIDRVVGPQGYDIGHAMLDFEGGESETGTSCSDARDADFFATHKAAAWSGAGGSPARALDTFIHVLGRQIGAWPTANGCQRDTLDDRAFEPGGGSTAMGYAFATCRAESVIQTHADRYLHGANIEQIHDWLDGPGGRCATRRLLPVAAPWIDPRSLDRRLIVPARTPFTLSARAMPGAPGLRLTYTWEQMDAGDAQRGPPIDDGQGPLFRSLPPTPAAHRDLPASAGSAGETLPTTSRDMTFRLTVRDNAGDAATTAATDVRVRVFDTGRPFALIPVGGETAAKAGAPLPIRWDVAGTNLPPLSCHFVHVALSTDGGASWRTIATDEPNDGAASPLLPDDAAGRRARVRVGCDNRPFFASSAVDFSIAEKSASLADIRNRHPLQR